MLLKDCLGWGGVGWGVGGQGIIYKYREDNYQEKMWFPIGMFSASKVYSKDRDANNHKFKYIHSPSSVSATMTNNCASIPFEQW